MSKPFSAKASPAPNLESPPSVYGAHARLCDVEERFELFRHTLDGWSAWPLLRFEVSLELAGLNFSRRHVVTRGGRIRRALYDLPSLIRIKHARHVIKTYNSGLIHRSGDRYLDMRFDDVLLAAGSTFKIEAVNNPRFLDRQSVVPRSMTAELLDLLALVVRRFRVQPGIVDLAAELSRVLTGPLGLSHATPDWVAHRLERFAAQKAMYKWLLRRIRPSYVLVADSGEHALMAAASELKIPNLELQHGTMDRSHAAYVWPASAIPYRSRMPIADRLLLYGEHWRGELNESGFWGDDLRVVGSPRLDLYRRDTKLRNDTCCQLLFTTQGLDLDRCVAFLREFLEKATARTALHLVIKLHPVYDVDKRPYLEALQSFSDYVTVLASDEGASTFELLQMSHLHVSISSASHYDALGLGVPTAILPFETHEVVLPLYEIGHASLVSTPQDLAELACNWRRLAVPPGISEYYFAPNACENILGELALKARSTANPR